MKKILCLLIVMGLTLSCISANAATLYATDGRTIEVADAEIEVWENVGWYRESNTIMVYAEDGREARIPVVAFDLWHSVGWYSAPVMRVYATDGRSEIILKADYDAWKKVGWMDAPIEKVYADSLGAVCKTAEEYFSSAMPSYIYYDINKDGVKEMIVDNGLYEAGREYYVYTIIDGNSVFVGKIHGSHTMLGHIPNENGVLLMWGHMGYFGASRVELTNGTLVSKTVRSERYYAGDYPQSWDIVKGSFDLDMIFVD